MSRTGVTFLELMVVVVIVGVIAMMGFPKIKDSLDKSNVRSARVAAGTVVATARGAAIQRGCRAVAHFDGVAGTMWVTVCPRMSTTGSGTIDTVTMVEKIEKMYSVDLTYTLDSVQFDPRGLSLTNAQATVRFTTTSGARDSILINSLGKVVR